MSVQPQLFYYLGKARRCQDDYTEMIQMSTLVHCSLINKLHLFQCGTLMCQCCPRLSYAGFLLLWCFLYSYNFS